eukprot:768273-Hanusia_phi.AAC.8
MAGGGREGKGRAEQGRAEQGRRGEGKAGREGEENQGDLDPEEQQRVIREATERLKSDEDEEVRGEALGWRVR